MSVRRGLAGNCLLQNRKSDLAARLPRSTEAESSPLFGPELRCLRPIFTAAGFAFSAISPFRRFRLFRLERRKFICLSQSLHCLLYRFSKRLSDTLLRKVCFYEGSFRHLLDITVRHLSRLVWGSLRNSRFNCIGNPSMVGLSTKGFSSREGALVSPIPSQSDRLDAQASMVSRTFPPRSLSSLCQLNSKTRKAYSTACLFVSYPFIKKGGKKSS